MKNGDMPAMPVRDADNEPLRLAHYPVYQSGEFATGLTKREAFAMAAMQGLCTIRGYGDIEDITHDAVRYADALLAELERTKSS